MKKFQPTSSKNECPVCGDIRGRCRTTDTELVLCMTHNASISEWRYLGQSKNGGMWGKFVPTSKETAEIREARNKRAEERAAINQARLARSKNKAQRHADYSHMIRYTKLSDATKADLFKRGIKDEDIAKLQPIEANGGYIIPIRDKDGYMVGGQIRLSKPGLKGRYRWATVGENRLPETGELPLAHWQLGESRQCYLVEGTGIKPYLAAKRIGAMVIGAAGGCFTASPQTLKATVTQHPECRVVLIPDAGAVANPHVMRQYANTVRLIRSWGRDVDVLWWGQFAKANGDIDEIGPEVATWKITWNEYAALAKVVLKGRGQDIRFLTEEIRMDPVWRTFEELGITGEDDEQFALEQFEDETSPNEDDGPEGDGQDQKGPYYESNLKDGLSYVSYKKNEDGGYDKVRTKIGDHLTAIAYVDSAEGDDASLLLEFKQIRGAVVNWTMPRSALALETAEMLGKLLRKSYYFKPRCKALLIDYLSGLGRDIKQTYTITDSTGWVGDSFVLPHKTYGDPDLRFREVTPSEGVLTEGKGDLDGWTTNVAGRCSGNSRLILGLTASFAAPMLAKVGIESGGFHLVGVSSKGKTIILGVAASVTGVREMPRWRTTSNGLEGVATAFNHLCLPIDEIGQAEPKDVGMMAYMLGNGQGKNRMNKDTSNRKPKTWQLIFLSSGEIGIGDYMSQAGHSQKSGQEVRCPDVPALPEGSIFGCFEHIHGEESPEDFAAKMEAAVRNYHGCPMDVFLTRLVEDAKDPRLVETWIQRVRQQAALLSQEYLDSVISRVAKRFALCQVAGEIAHSYGLLPFPAAEIAWAIKTCFDDWVRMRGGDGSIEIKRAVDRVRLLLTTEELGDRVFTLPDNDGRPARKLLAYRKAGLEGTEELLVPVAVFNEEFCKGVNRDELVEALLEAKLLKSRDAHGDIAHRVRINGQQKRVVVFRFEDQE